MKKSLTTAFSAVAVATAALSPGAAHADRGGAVAAGVAGGLVGGLVLGSALQARPRYYEPAPVYAAPPPPPPPACYWTRGEPVWDGYRGVWVRPRIQVCD